MIWPTCGGRRIWPGALPAWWCKAWFSPHSSRPRAWTRHWRRGDGRIGWSVWLLNWELSDNPRAQVPAGAGEDGRGRRPVGPGGGFGGPGGAGFGRPFPEDREASGRERSAQFQAVADLLAAPRQMTITHDAREILFRYDDGRYVRLVPDAREHAGIAGGTRVTRKVRWEGDTLVAEVKLESNQKIVHEFELRLGGEQLVVTTTLEPRGSQDELQLRRVFDAAGE